MLIRNTCIVYRQDGELFVGIITRYYMIGPLSNRKRLCDNGIIASSLLLSGSKEVQTKCLRYIFFRYIDSIAAVALNNHISYFRNAYFYARRGLRSYTNLLIYKKYD